MENKTKFVSTDGYGTKTCSNCDSEYRLYADGNGKWDYCPRCGYKIIWKNTPINPNGEVN